MNVSAPEDVHRPWTGEAGRGYGRTAQHGVASRTEFDECVRARGGLNLVAVFGHELALQLLQVVEGEAAARGGGEEGGGEGGARGRVASGTHARAERWGGAGLGCGSEVVAHRFGYAFSTRHRKQTPSW